MSGQAGDCFLASFWPEVECAAHRKAVIPATQKTKGLPAPGLIEILGSCVSNTVINMKIVLIQNCLFSVLISKGADTDMMGDGKYTDMRQTCTQGLPVNA